MEEIGINAVCKLPYIGNQSVSRPVSQSVSHSVSQPINQSTNQLDLCCRPYLSHARFPNLIAVDKWAFSWVARCFGNETLYVSIYINKCRISIYHAYESYYAKLSSSYTTYNLEIWESLIYSIFFIFIIFLKLFIYLFIYLSRGIQFSRASLNGAPTKHKNKDIEKLKLDNQLS